MTEGCLRLWLEQMDEAARQALAYVEGMRNRIAHGYFELNISVVWETVQRALPDLLTHLPAVRTAAEDWPTSR